MPLGSRSIIFFSSEETRTSLVRQKKLWRKRIKKRLLYKNIQGSRQDIKAAFDSDLRETKRDLLR